MVVLFVGWLHLSHLQVEFERTRLQAIGVGGRAWRCRGMVKRYYLEQRYVAFPLAPYHCLLHLFGLCRFHDPLLNEYSNLLAFRFHHLATKNSQIGLVYAAVGMLGGHYPYDELKHAQLLTQTDDAYEQLAAMHDPCTSDSFVGGHVGATQLVVELETCHLFTFVGFVGLPFIVITTSCADNIAFEGTQSCR